MNQWDDNPEFCETCGAQLFEDAIFCSQCGMPIPGKNEKTSRAEKTEEADPGKLRLYQVHSVVNNFRYKNIYYDNVKINWYVAKREIPPIPFEQAILNYSQLPVSIKIHPENFIKERFTREEAESLKHYLYSVEKINASIEPLPLPVNDSVSGYRDFPPSPGTDFFILHNRQGYNLPFKVEGIFNIKMADERVIGDDRITVVSGLSIKDLEKHFRNKDKEKSS